MKKALLILGICTIVTAACSSSGSKSVQDTTPVVSQTNNENRSLTDTLGAETGGSTTADTNKKVKN